MDVPSGQLFYAGSIEGDQVIFDTFESRHLIKVLRKQTGDLIRITDGRGRLVTARIQIFSPHRVGARIIESRSVPPPRRKLHVLVAPPKKIDRFEWFLEKAVELGVWSVTPVITDRGERRKLNFERLEKIIISALKQSLRLYKPVLHPWITLDDALRAGNVFAARCHTGQNAMPRFLQSPEARVLIGPEGGFSPGELEAMDRLSVPAILLSAQRLRTETAAVAAVCRYYTP